MENRLGCCAPLCRRTVARDKLRADHDEWLCQIHWKLVPKTLKRRKKLAEKIADRAEARFMQRYEQQGGYTIAQLQRVQSAKNLAHKAWERCKAAAIERAVGL